MPFRFTRSPIDGEHLRRSLAVPACGGFAAFEGWVRDHNEGSAVRRLEYEAFEALGVKEGERILAEAVARFGVTRIACDLIDEIKHLLPIWKKEHYANGDSGWVNCERCATAGEAGAHAHHRHG